MHLLHRMNLIQIWVKDFKGVEVQSASTDKLEIKTL